MSRPKTKVLFVCKHNSARSQMAEAFLRHYAGDRFEVYSAGLEPAKVHPLAVRVMQEIGIDISHHKSEPISYYLGRLKVGYAVVVCHIDEEAYPSLYPFTRNLWHWPFEDPASFEGGEEERLAKFREIRDLIGRRGRAWVEEIAPGNQAPSA